MNRTHATRLGAAALAAGAALTAAPFVLSSPATATEANTAALAEAAALAETYSVDVVHSGVYFRIDRAGIPFNGRFDKFDGSFTLDEVNPSASTFEASIEIGSVSTGNGDRDKHLRAADMFNARQFPTAEFKSTSVSPSGEAGVWTVEGDMTFMGVTKSISADLMYHGSREMFGKTLAGFTAEFAIERTEFGFTKYVEGDVLSDTVHIRIDVTGTQG